jgi:predicted transposase/invertase (TIGR01784 family)
MLDYWVRLYRAYRLPITQVVILLLPPSADTEIETTFECEQTRHQFQVIKIWEQDPNIFLADPALLPFAALASVEPNEELLMQVAQEVSKMEYTAQRQETASYVQILAGLRFDTNLIKRLFNEDIMKESALYQEWRQENLSEGRVEGRIEGQEEGQEAERRSIALKMLAEGMSLEIIAKITGYSIDQIQSLQSV